MNMLMAFAPFAAFALLERMLGMHTALLAATGVSAFLIFRETIIGKKGLKPLEAVSLVMFGALAILAKRSELHLTVITVRLIVDAGLLAFVVLSLLIGKPFTLAYAKDKVSAQVAESKRFRAMNGWLSALWGLAFAVVVAADGAMVYVANFTVMDGTIAIVSALGAAALFSTVLPKMMAPKHTQVAY